MSNEKPRYMTVKEVSEWFGVNPMTVYRHARKGEIPSIKFGKTWLFPEDALKAWLQKKLEKKSGETLAVLDVGKIRVKGLQLLYIFGSSLSGENTPLSDIDIAYLDDGKISSFDLEAVLERTLREKLDQDVRIDLVRLNSAPVAVQYKAISTGKNIFASSENILADFEEKVVAAYLDYELVLKKFYKESYGKAA